jgi:hypothetical protein
MKQLKTFFLKIIDDTVINAINEQIYDWLEKDQADALVIKADRKDPLVILPIMTFKGLIEREK